MLLSWTFALGDCETASTATEPSPKNEEKHQKDMERLHKQIDRYREIIDQQEQLIQVVRGRPVTLG